MRIPQHPIAWAALLSSLHQVACSQQPFLPAATPTVAYQLSRRQDGSGCLTGTYSCSSQGAAFNGICCAVGQLCALDQANSPACCPAGAVCTGVAPAQFVPPAATAISFVPNQFFSYPYIPTVFANQAACTSAVAQCSRNYDACTAYLQGQAVPNPTGGYGVTINVPGPGGTTIVGGAAGGAAPVNYGPVTATSVCASLSRVGCFGIQNNVCQTTGAVAGGFFVGNANTAFARPTPPPVLVGMGVVAGLGAAWGGL